MLRRRLDGFAVSINRPVSQLTAGGRLAQPAQHVFFCNSKGQHGFETKLAFLASHEARCSIQRTGKPHQTGEPWHLSCHGGKTRPSRMSLYAPARQRRAVRGQGALPLVRAMRPVAEWRSFLFNKQGKHTRPASREARCRAAVKPRPSSMSPYAPARLWRAVRKGAQPPWMSTGRSVSWKGSVSPLRS